MNTYHSLFYTGGGLFMSMLWEKRYNILVRRYDMLTATANSVQQYRIRRQGGKLYIAITGYRERVEEHSLVISRYPIWLFSFNLLIISLMHYLKLYIFPHKVVGSNINRSFQQLKWQILMILWLCSIIHNCINNARFIFAEKFSRIMNIHPYYFVLVRQNIKPEFAILKSSNPIYAYSTAIHLFLYASWL